MSIGAFGENFPYTNFHELNMDWIIKIVKTFSEQYPEVMEEIEKRVLKPENNPNGNAGEYLTSNGDGTTSWTDMNPIIISAIYEAVAEWLDEHPEATTTVEDGSLTSAKFTDALKLETLKDYGTPEMYGASGDGVSDDTNAIQLALNNHGTVILVNKYRVANTIYVPSKRSVIFYGNSQIIADTPQGSLPVFVLDTVSNVEFIGMGGAEPNITGTCSIVFHIKGTDNFSISPGNYSKFLKFKDLWISDNTGIELGFYLDTAVRQMVIDNCTVYCNNAVYAHGKTVENTISNSIIWATKTGGYAIKIDSDLTDNKYNEGWTISNCTIDTTDKSTGTSIEVADIWVFQMTNSYIGSEVTIKAPTTTTRTEDILLSNCEFYGTVKTDGNTAYHLMINNCVFNTHYLQINQNAQYATVSDCIFKGGSSNMSGIIVGNGANHITIHDIRIDHNYGAGINLTGTNGTDTIIHDIVYNGTGNIIYSQRSYIGHHNGTLASTKTSISRSTYATGETIGTCQRAMQVKQTGNAIIKTTLHGCASNQIVKVEIENTDIGFFIPLTGDCFLSMVIPFICSTTGNVKVKLTNYSGNTVTTDYHDYIQIIET